MLALFHFVFIYLKITIGVNGQDGDYFCEDPIVESENIIDTKFIHQNFKNGWNIQFGNAVYLKWATKTLLGKDASNATESSNMCLRNSFDFLDDQHLFGYHAGFDDLTSDWNCTELNHIFDCQYYSIKFDYRASAKNYIVYFDQNVGHNSMAVALCYPDGTVGWYVESVSKELTDEETTTIINRLRTVGFDTGAKVPFRSENCP